jgi:predicted DCC family thiol-disulfide oxidoreductase YuxK
VNIARRELELLRALQQEEQRKVDLVVIYDGQCIFCNSYIKLLRLRASAGEVLLRDARAGNLVKQVKSTLGLDLDDGMLVLYGDRAYYGADGMHILASLTSRSNAWNALTAFVFRRRWLARLLYPLLKAGRLMALFLLGRPRINASKAATTR